MYLNKRTYIGANYEHNNITGVIDLKKNGKTIAVKLDRVSYITESVGYWRKANHIHNWFVSNVQEGEDNCGDYYVSEDQLKQLVADCKAVLADKANAATAMPTVSGFFFGGTDYDDSYFEDCEETIKIIEAVLSERSEDGKYMQGEIYYHSSW